MNETMNVIMSRRSYRSYTTEKVSDSDLMTICEAGTYAASGMNKQSASIILIKDQKVLEEFRRLGTLLRGKDPFYGAVHLIVVVASTTSRLYIQDASLVLGNMMLACESLNLASCWINCIQDILDMSEASTLREALNLKSDEVAIGSIIVGHFAGEKPIIKPRKEDYIRII